MTKQHPYQEWWRDRPYETTATVRKTRMRANAIQHSWTIRGTVTPGGNALWGFLLFEEVLNGEKDGSENKRTKV
ncbi:MAG: hypothetical protein KCHDKBKB_01973 [Elusimicrobia bacterium]|nr:hypothetical protein [Elusimicrobiota bacterium]